VPYRRELWHRGADPLGLGLGGHMRRELFVSLYIASGGLAFAAPCAHMYDAQFAPM
jgi:hypothetical protein